MHIYVRLERRWGFDEVRRSALALAREVETRAPSLATSQWWKEERHGVFVDYNQNAKDRTVASAYSVRPNPDARVSTPLAWDEVDACNPADFTLASVPARFKKSATSMRRSISTRAPSQGLLELFERQGRGMRHGRRTTEGNRQSPLVSNLPKGKIQPVSRDRARAPQR